MGFGDGSGISWIIRKLSAPRSRQTTTPALHHSICTGRMLFLTTNQQCPITDGKSKAKKKLTTKYVGCQFSGTSNSSLILLLSRLCILQHHFTSLAVFLAVFSVCSGHLRFLTSYKFLALITFSVLSLSMQLPQLFDPVCSSDTFNSFCWHLKTHLFLASFSRPTPSRSSPPSPLQ